MHFIVPYKTVENVWRPGQALCGLATLKSKWTSEAKNVTCKRCLISLAWASANDSVRTAKANGYNEADWH